MTAPHPATDGQPFAAVIFDFNGVLLWDNPLHEEAFARFSVRFRQSPITREEMRRALHGRVNRDIMEYILGRAPTEAEAQAMAEEKETLYRELARAEGDAYRLSPGAIELLDYLVAHDIPRAIATSSPKSNVDFFIERLHLLRWFDEVRIVYDDGRYPGKPAPGIYLETAQRLGLPPARCLVVEDSLMGIESARRAGAGAIIGIGPSASEAVAGGLPGVRLTIPDLTRFPRQLLSTPA